jgi:hypothetical protein
VQLLLTKAKKRTDTIYKIKKGTVNSGFVIWWLCFTVTTLESNKQQQQSCRFNIKKVNE